MSVDERARVLFVSGSESMNGMDALEDTLVHEGLAVDRYRTTDFALEQLSTEGYGVIIHNLSTNPGTFEGIKEVSEKKQPTGQLEPWMFGIRFIEKVRSKEGPNQNTPIVVLSVYSEVGDKVFPDAGQETLNAGANNYFQMPFEVRNFLLTVSGYLE